MQFTKLITVVAAAGFVAAAPTTEDSNNAPTCQQNQQVKCCESFVPGLLGGILSNIGIGCLDVIGGSCSQQQACCEQNNNGISVIQVCQLL